MYRVDLRNLVKNKLFICREYHIQPSEIDKFKYYEYEWILEEIKVIEKEQEKQNEKQQKEMSSMKSQYNPQNMMSNMKMPSMTMPKINIPKI